MSTPEAFRAELGKVATECFRILKPTGYCAVLIGDVRRDGRFIDLGYLTKGCFLAAGFETYENIIKVQHRSGQTAFWQARRRTTAEREQPDAPPLLLMAHEYLFIFRKPQPKDHKTHDESGDEKPLV